MTKTETIQFQIEPELKTAAENILQRLGLSTTEAVTVFLNQVILNEGLPFEVKLPSQKNISPEHRQYILEKLHEAETYAALPDAKYYTWDEFWADDTEDEG
jgi:DNA-damage-inducible protein J